jgi:uncharacterized protein (DUF1778 family)
MGREYTDAQRRATLKYLTESTDNVQLRVPRGTKERWKAAADVAGVSMTKFVQDAVEAAIAAAQAEKESRG